MVALYRRYRPDKFADVIGQGHVTDSLRHALDSGRIHHAYLFSGPRGCGKTTSARILARCLNCERGPTSTPCETCASCVELAMGGGGSLDVVEIDAASHNGVDDARELRERAIFAPARDRFKIFILDEAHMVTQQGFNALLKIVEEPPEHVKFIFATTEPEKVITTIRSRTHHYPFKLVPPGELHRYLESMLKSEGIAIEEGVAALVIRSGGGSVRDTLSLMDQLIAGSGNALISLDAARALLGYTPSLILDQLLNAISELDARRTFRTINGLLEAGHDPRRFTEDLLTHLRDVILVQATESDAKNLFPGVSDVDFDRWAEQANIFSSSTLSRLAQVVSQALTQMSGVTPPRLQLELLVAELLVQQKGSQAGQIKSPELGLEVATPVESKKTDSRVELADFTPEKTSEEDSTHSSVDLEPGLPLDLAQIRNLWPEILEELASSKRSLWVAMSGTAPLKLEDDVLTIGFPRRGNAEILKKPQGPGSPLPNADLLREAIYARSGHRLRFTVDELTSGTPKEPPSAGMNEAWPEVSKAPAESPQSSLAEPEVSQGVDLGVIDIAEPPASGDPTTPIASRGEPVVRQLLGGELVAEEILDEMSSQGEADV